MPFDFLKMKPYKINYDTFFEELNKNKILNDKMLQEAYLRKWKEVLIEHDNVLLNGLKTSEDIKNLLNKMINEPRSFQLPIEFESNEILLHFRVDPIRKFIIENKINGGFIDLNEFISENRSIEWNPVEEDVSHYSKNNEPIIMVPFFIGKTSHLVIDGNHRLTYKTKNKINNIHAVTIAEETVINNYMLASSFDKLYYTMHNELVYMGNKSITEDIEPLLLLQRSYLKDGEYKLNKY